MRLSCGVGAGLYGERFGPQLVKQLGGSEPPDAVLLEQLGECGFAYPSGLVRSRHALPQGKSEGCRHVVLYRGEKLRVVAPELFPELVFEAVPVVDQLFSGARQLAQPDDVGIGGLPAAQTLGVGAQRRGERPCIPAIVLGAGDREAVSKPVELLGVDRIDGEAAPQEALDHRSVGHLDWRRRVPRKTANRFPPDLGKPASRFPTATAAPTTTGSRVGPKWPTESTPERYRCAGLPSVRPMTGAQSGSRVARLPPPGFWLAAAAGR